MIINESGLMGLAQSYRLVWLSGRFGGGKTSFAYRMAYEFCNAQGYRLVSNNHTIWADDIKDVKLDKNGHLHCVVILDEGGLWFKASRQIEMIASYAAKMDVIYLLPSFWPPTRSAQVLVIQPLWSLVSAGVPAIIYKWRVNLGGFKDSGVFVWVLPSEVYGVYSRQDPGDAGQEIVEWLMEQTEAYRAMHGHKRSNGFSEMAAVGPDDYLSDAAISFAEAADTLATLPSRKRGRN